MKAKLFHCSAHDTWFLQFSVCFSETTNNTFSETEVADIVYWCNHFSRFHGISLQLSYVDSFHDLKTYYFTTRNQSRILLVSELICKALGCGLDF